MPMVSASGMAANSSWIIGEEKICCRELETRDPVFISQQIDSHKIDKMSLAGMRRNLARAYWAASMVSMWTLTVLSPVTG